METTSHCAYNLMRRLVLSERVVLVSVVESPAQLVATVLNGPGRDSNSAIWVTHPERAVDIPRLFAFDVVYLDGQQTIVEAASVGPATPFPSLASQAASILFLPDHCLARSKTVVGDRLKICLETELLDFLRDSSRSELASPEQHLTREAKSQEVADAFTANVHPRFTELFSASLIYLPSAGGPQRSEFFLRTDSPSASQSEISAKQQAGTEQVDSITPEFVEQEPMLAQDSPTRRETDSIPEEPPLVSPQLPPSLRAVLHSVDEQIRREGKAQQSDQKLLKRADIGKPPETSVPERLQQPPVPSPQVTATRLPEEHAVLSGSSPVQNLPELKELSRVENRPVSPATPDGVHSPARPEPSRSEPAQNPVETDALAGIEPTRQRPKAESPAPPSPSKQVELRSREVKPVSEAKERLSIAARLRRWFSGESTSLSGNRRRGERFSPPGLVAFYWTGGAPTPHEIVNISTSGLYLRSKELWSRDTLVRMTLERQDAEWERPESISVLVRVVRRDDGGVAHEFIMTEVLENLRVRDFLPEHGTDRKELQKFLAFH